MAIRHILLVEDEAPLREVVAEQLMDRGFHVEQAASGEEAIDRLASFAFDIVITDLRLGGGADGTVVLDEARAVYPDIIGIIVTGYGTVKDAVEAIKRGATDFIQKPFQFDELLHIINTALEQRRLRAENAYLRKQLEERYRFEGIIGKSAAMRELFALLETVAQTGSTILVTGETGTGKELVAHAIHHNSPRRAQRFVAIHCGAIPETLLEAELFGHTRGAFTGADRARKGLFLEADRGTLFLDEIGELPMPMQTKLLHVIEDKQVRPVGSEQSRRVDVRIVAATNRDLPAMIGEGAFREDLYFRLSMFQIQLPPLRERQSDIRPFIQFLLQNGRNGAERPIELEPEAEDMLLGYSWPGNVRELDNVINRARILAEGNRITVADLPSVVVASSVSSVPRHNGHDRGLRERMRRVEVEIIEEAIASAGGDRRVAAQQLGISLSSLYRKLGEAGDQRTGASGGA
jgi:two-component system response regulator AtoC